MAYGLNLGVNQISISNSQNIGVNVYIAAVNIGVAYLVVGSNLVVTGITGSSGIIGGSSVVGINNR